MIQINTDIFYLMNVDIKIFNEEVIHILYMTRPIKKEAKRWFLDNNVTIPYSSFPKFFLNSLLMFEISAQQAAKSGLRSRKEKE